MKVCVLTSGGDAPGMNAFLEALSTLPNLYGALEGFKGLVEGNFVKLENISGIASQGGSIIKSSRFFINEIALKKAVANMEKENFDALVVVGGNGSLAASEGLAEHLNVFFVPATIDNDVLDMESIGFDTALNNIVEAIDKIRDTAKTHNRAFLIETMGRNSEKLASFANLAAPDSEMLRENSDLNSLAKSIKNSEYSLIIMPESVKVESKLDILEKESGKKIKHIVLGHIQRGGAPSAHDRALATLYASDLIEELNSDK